MPEGAKAEVELTEYQSQLTTDIEMCVAEMGCQPILFVGSGLSKRYFAAPNWDELLGILSASCPLINKEYAYYKQTLKDPTEIGKEFARLYQEWAWGDGRDQFPAELFAAEVPAQSYIKFKIAEILAKLTPATLSDLPQKELANEVKSLQEIQPHALITTNYDSFLEIVFPDYQPIVGQNIIRGTQALPGEIFKIHGSVADFSTLVFTKEDYDDFARKKKYLSAKLLTFFIEHPLLFIGYSATDANIRAILSDIDECLPRPEGAVIPNIYLLEWRADAPSGYVPPREKIISVGEDRSIRIKFIETSDFSWVFKAFGSNEPLNAVNPKLLRAVLSRTYDLVRYDIPRRTVQADFKFLEGAVSTDQSFAKLFGITTVGAGTASNAQFPFTMTDLAIRLTGDDKAYWAAASKFVDRVSKELGVSIRSSDNRYHIKTRTGRMSSVHKYSKELLEVITHMSRAEDYALEPITVPKA